MLASRLYRCTRQSARVFSSSARRAEHFLNADKSTFDKVTSPSHTADRVVLVDFYADWCGPCKTLSPILERVTADESVKSGSGLPLDLITVDTDAEVALAQQHKVRSLPTVVAFKDGQPVSQFIGALPEAQVRKFIESL